MGWMKKLWRSYTISRKAIGNWRRSPPSVYVYVYNIYMYVYINIYNWNRVIEREFVDPRASILIETLTKGRLQLYLQFDCRLLMFLPCSFIHASETRRPLKKSAAEKSTAKALSCRAREFGASLFSTTSNGCALGPGTLVIPWIENKKCT